LGDVLRMENGVCFDVEGAKSTPASYLTQILNLFTLFEKSSPDANTRDQTAYCDVSMENFFVVRWLKVALSSLQKYLKVFKLELRVEGSLLFFKKENDVRVTLSEIKQIVKDLETLFEKKIVLFAYKESADRTIKGCARIIGKYCPYLDAAAIEKIHIEVNAVCGLDDMIPYETKWCAWPDYGFVSMPDVDNLPEGHILFMRQRTHNPNKIIPKGRFLALFGGSCYRVPCHEVIHIIQGIAKQSGNIFQAEHDASYAMMVLMWAVSRLESVSDMFVEGMCELLLMQQIRTGNKIWKNLNESERKEYVAWRDAFGLVECPGWRNEGPEGLKLESQMKGLIAAEGICPSGEVKMPDEAHVKKTLDLLFENRRGNVLTLPVNVIPELKIEANRIEKLSCPAKEQEWKELTSRLV